MSPIYIGPGATPLGRKGIEVILEKYAFSPGETIKGKVALKLKKPMHAKQLTVALQGVRISRTAGAPVGHMGPGYHHGSHHGSNQQITPIYDFKIPLDGEATYFNELYPFEIAIPSDLLQSMQQTPPSPPGGGLLAELAKTAQAMAQAYSRVEWYVEARLDIPLNIDVSGIQKIVIS